MLNTKKQGPTEPQARAKAKNQKDNEFKSNDFWINIFPGSMKKYALWTSSAGGIVHIDYLPHEPQVLPFKPLCRL